MAIFPRSKKLELGFAIAFELGMNLRAGAHHARSDSGHVNVVPSQLRARASEKPTKANLLAVYGAMCGTAILPPMDEMFTMRPPP